MDRDFEKFRGGANEAMSKRLHVTISPAKLILLNRNVYEQLGKPEAVALYYSRERDMIGIAATSPRFNDSFPVLTHSRSWRINAAPFCRHFNICIDRTLKFLTPVIRGTELHLNLGQTISVARERRPKKKQ
jgi:hypothetical protein